MLEKTCSFATLVIILLSLYFFAIRHRKI